VSVARFGRLDSSSSCIYSYACSLIHLELSWAGVNSSLHLYVAHMLNCSHYALDILIGLHLPGDPVKVLLLSSTGSTVESRARQAIAVPGTP
jgi:hypothetical protein